MFEDQIEQCEAELELYHSELNALRSDDIPNDEQATEINALEDTISDLRSHLVAMRNALRAANASSDALQSSPPESAATHASMSSMDSPASAPSGRAPQSLPDDAIRWGDEAHYASREQLLSQPEFADGRVPRDYGMDGLSEIAPERLQSINESAAAAGRSPIEPASLPGDVNPNQIDPHGPTRGEVGHVASYNEHRSSQNPNARADYDAAGARISEIEHPIAGAQLREVGIDPETGSSQYQHYDQDVTYWNEREAALNKTHGNRGGAGADNPTTRRMQAATQAGQAHDLADTAIHARENAQRAAAATNSSVPGQSIDAAVYHQMSNMSGASSTQETMEALASMPDEPTTLNMSTFDEDFMSGFADDAIPEPRMSSVPDDGVPGAAARSMPDDGISGNPMSLADDVAPQSGGVMRGLGRAAQVAGDGLAVAGVAMSGYQVGSGVNQLMEGEVAQGSVNIAEGSTNIGMEIGTTYAVQSGAVVAEGGAAAASVTVLAGIAATGALAWAFEDTRRALEGRPTMLDEAIEAWSTQGLGVLTQFVNELPNIGDALMSDAPPEDEYTNVRGLPNSENAD